MQKRFYFFLLTIILILTLNGCGRKSVSSFKEPQTESSASCESKTEKKESPESTVTISKETDSVELSYTNIVSEIPPISETIPNQNNLPEKESANSSDSLPENIFEIIESASGYPSETKFLPAATSPKSSQTDTIREKDTKKPNVIGDTPRQTAVTTTIKEHKTPQSATHFTIPPATTTAKETVPETTAAIQNITVTLSITCTAALNHPDLNPAVTVPSDGIILNSISITLPEGSTIYDAFEKACRSKNISYEYTGTPLRKNIYISSIAGLSQMDCGQYSGWKYSVNGTEPAAGVSMYKIKNADIIHLHYTTTV